MSGSISALFDIMGYVAGFLFSAVPLAGLWLLIRGRAIRHDELDVVAHGTWPPGFDALPDRCR